jgi:hypothetical protein
MACFGDSFIYPLVETPSASFTEISQQILGPIDATFPLCTRLMHFVYRSQEKDSPLQYRQTSATPIKAVLKSTCNFP